MYCNLIQCDHFRDTCVVAERDGVVLGWVSAYVMPSDPDTLFVWQVAVSAQARGMGLGTKMLADILDRDDCDEVTRLQTTITRDNEASWSLFPPLLRAPVRPLRFPAPFHPGRPFHGAAPDRVHGHHHPAGADEESGINHAAPARAPQSIAGRTYHVD